MLHLWVAERFCEINGFDNPAALQELMLAAELPDIRYITQMPRELIPFAKINSYLDCVGLATNF